MSLNTIIQSLTVLVRKRANPSAYYRFMRFLQSASTFLDSGSMDHTYRDSVDPSFCFFPVLILIGGNILGEVF